MAETPHRKRPCQECPWRRDTAPGQFAACRYDELERTTGSPGHEAPIGSPWFACHKTPDERPAACAGWLAAVGREHLGVRVAVAMGRLPAESLAPDQNWPELWPSYAQMREAMQS